MTLAEARAVVKFDTAADIEPIVTDVQLDDILGRLRVPDHEYRDVDDDDWAGAYNLLEAKALVYDRKAAMLASQVTFSADGSKFDLSARVERFREMAAACRARSFTGVPVNLGPYNEEMDYIVEP